MKRGGWTIMRKRRRRTLSWRLHVMRSFGGKFCRAALQALWVIVTGTARSWWSFIELGSVVCRSEPSMRTFLPVLSSSTLLLEAPDFILPHTTTASIMASSLRLGSSLLRSSSVLSRPAVQRAAYTGVRAASSKVTPSAPITYVTMS